MATFFVVQKCWYAGCPTFSPVDYPRLFPSQSLAQEVAFQSAHAYINGTDEPVRTISDGSNGFAFAAGNALFWSRSVQMANVSPCCPPCSGFRSQPPVVAWVECTTVLPNGNTPKGLVIGTIYSRKQRRHVKQDACVLGWNGTELDYPPSRNGSGTILRQVPIGPVNTSNSNFLHAWPEACFPLVGEVERKLQFGNDTKGSTWEPQNHHKRRCGLIGRRENDMAITDSDMEISGQCTDMEEDTALVYRPVKRQHIM